METNFKQQREELGLTQLDAAVLLGVSRVTYIKWEQEPDTMPLGKYHQLIKELKALRTLRESIESN